MGVKLGINIY